MSTQPVQHHQRACSGFGDVVVRVGDGWNRPSPCPEWDARGVLEHVIGFHDALLLRPLNAKPSRPKDDPVARWQVTVPVIFSVVEEHWDHSVAVPGSASLDLGALLPMLTADVVVHTWDLAKAAGVPVNLDPDLCETALAGARQRDQGLRTSGMFEPAVHVPADSPVADQLVAFLGRNPGWSTEG
jgi:uncharacterized protein (TIGR03086 family)